MAIRNYTELQEYKSKISALCVSTDEALAVFGRIYHKYDFAGVENLRHLEGKLQQANFKVIVIGKFSTGKSSLINTLLGEYVLPDSLSPCTAYINEITYGEEKQATIYFKHPLPEQWEDFVQNESVKEHIRQHNQGIVPPFVIPLEDLADCVTIPWNEDDEDIMDDNASLNISPFEKAVIQYPCELCRNGIEIIDSPGLDENQDRTEIVDKYLKRVDAVIYVMTNIATGGDSDKEIIETYLTQNDIKNVFFVCNLFGIPLRMAKKQLFGRLKKVFGDKTLLGERGIHLVNIRDLQNSGVDDFETALADYLNNEKGKAQLISYIEQLSKQTTAMKQEASGFDCVNDVNLVDINNKIAAVKTLIADDEQLLQKTATVITAIKEEILDYSIKESTEKYKKLDYAIRLDIRDRVVEGNELSSSATQEEALARSQELAQEFTVRMEKDLRDYVYQELTGLVIEDTEAELQELQRLVHAFTENVKAEPEEKLYQDFMGLAQIDSLIAEHFAESLTVDLAQLVAFPALQLSQMLQDIVKNIYVVYALYQNENRGAKLTSEVQNNVSLEVYKKLEKTKRRVVELVAERLLVALEELVFSKTTASMKQEIAKQYAILAAYEAEKLVILKHQEDEHQEAAKTLAQLQDNLELLTALRSSIEA